MKHKALTILSLALILSCDSLFHEDIDNYIVLDNDQEVLDILNGIYAQLARVYDQYYFEALCRADDINLYQFYNFEASLYTSGCGHSVTHDYAPNYDNIYYPLYKIILGANSAIPQLSGEEDPSILGEFYFLRAYAYYTLARFFGNPHIVTDIDVSYTLERPTYEEVYEFIEEDIKRALELLPGSYTHVRIRGETPHAGMAKALLAEVYLSWAGFPIRDNTKYQLAALYSGDVLNSEGSTGFGLLDDYASLWKSENKFNKETVFGLFYDFSNPATRNNIGFMFVGRDFFDSSLHVSSEYNPEFMFFDAMPLSYRKSCCFPANTMTLDPLRNPCGFIGGVHSCKWVDTIEYLENELSLENEPYTPHFSGYGTSGTLYLLRYGQTLLTFSEARARSGILDDSTYKALNMIRRRANGVDPYSPSVYDLSQGLSREQFIDSVVWERAWELNF